MRRADPGTDHFRKQVHIVVNLTGHLFPDRVEDFEKLWTTIHRTFLIADCQFPIVSLPGQSLAYPIAEKLIVKRQLPIGNHFTLSVVSETRNSGVTIIGT